MKAYFSIFRFFNSTLSPFEPWNVFLGHQIILSNQLVLPVIMPACMPLTNPGFLIFRDLLVFFNSLIANLLSNQSGFFG